MLEEDEKGRTLVSTWIAVIGAIVCFVLGFMFGITFPR
jgi:hypothetical protein